MGVGLDVETPTRAYRYPSDVDQCQVANRYDFWHKVSSSKAMMDLCEW